MTVIAQTTKGKIEGVRLDGLCVFKGVPFAAPPIGSRRWLPPEPMAAWSGIRPTIQFGAIAPQHVFFVANEVTDNPVMSALMGAMGNREREPQSEDCLYLNVWTPALDDARRPVMVWIHGGGFHSGSGSSSLYPGNVLAKRGNVVVVTINYRLGPLGFLNLRELTNGDIPATGNEGLLDQVAALEWVRDNILRFGGDPNNVTVFGESAGAMSIGSLMGMRSAQGLFRRAILQSGAAQQVMPLQRALRVCQRVLGVLGVKTNDIAAMRALTSEQLVAAIPQIQPKPGEPPDPEIGGAPMQPVIDGDILPTLPLHAIANGSAQGVEVITGCTLEENKLFSALRPELIGLSDEGLQTQLRQGVPDWDPKSIIDAYREARIATMRDANALELFNAIETDRGFRMSSIRLAETLRDRGQAAFHYLFAWTSPLLNGVFGACHAIDLGFVWDTYKGSIFSGTGPDADALANNVQDAWIRFAHTGNPSCASVGQWPVYGLQRNTMLLNSKCQVVADPYAPERQAWSGVPDSIVGRV